MDYMALHLKLTPLTTVVYEVNMYTTTLSKLSLLILQFHVEFQRVLKAHLLSTTCAILLLEFTIIL